MASHGIGEANSLPAARRVIADWMGVALAQLEPVPDDIIRAIMRRLSSSEPSPGVFQVELVDRLRSALEEMHILARTDALTGLANRRSIEEALSEEVQRVSRYGRPLAVLLADVDGLKQLNDQHGHLAGDLLLREVAGRLRGECRPSDLVGRWGGDEFVMICPETDAHGAATLAWRLSEAVAAVPLKLPIAERVHPQISIGVATATSLTTADDLVRQADEALYRAKTAKKSGRTA